MASEPDIPMANTAQGSSKEQPNVSMTDTNTDGAVSAEAPSQAPVLWTPTPGAAPYGSSLANASTAMIGPGSYGSSLTNASTMMINPGSYSSSLLTNASTVMIDPALAVAHWSSVLPPTSGASLATTSSAGTTGQATVATAPTFGNSAGSSQSGAGIVGPSSQGTAGPLPPDIPGTRGSGGTNPPAAIPTRADKANNRGPAPAHLEVDSRCGVCTGFIEIDDLVVVREFHPWLSRRVFFDS